MALLTFLSDLSRQFLPSFSNKTSLVTTYTRELPINLERMYENALDYEHLPFLHSSTFSKLEILDAGDWGWKAKACLQPKSVFNKMTLELKLDTEKNRWVTKTLSGLGKGTEVWTHAIPISENKIKVIVDFYVPKLPFFLRKKYTELYSDLYAQLYDEDLWMMSDRQKELDKLKKTDNLINEENKILGTLEEIKPQLPYNFEFNNKNYRLIELNNNLIAHSTICPHMLGPLNDADLNNGILECPWHGYKFDINTRKCISGQKCRMAPAPKIIIENKIISAIKN
ncbi:Rieske (2Fe-2S) protein [uncultured Polaribacter sp.]|uniref:Rieske (2Fe-2S) protein n=1 Tax=uncultured Polaribacter sp. TaxID=174711 RepID=UPI00261C5204|nr:Rieske (2Fe-2S) protein [uncultured Polaribacter sp.]